MQRPEDHIKLVYCVMNRFYKYFRTFGSFDEDDLFQVGCIGLLKACRKFDENRGVKFSTYATSCITGEILRFLRENVSSVKMPKAYRLHERVQAKAASLNRTIDDIGHEFQDLFGVEEDFTTLFVEEMISRLNEHEQWITRLRIHGYTQSEIGNQIGCSQPQINRQLRQIQMKLAGMA